MPPLLFAPLCQFAAAAAAKLKLAGGAPEEQLRAPLEHFIQGAGALLAMKVVCKGEYQIQDIGRPDYAVYCNDVLAGYIEIKQPGKGADPERYHNHDKKQWERFKSLPNIIYTDVEEWALYQNGERVGGSMRLAGPLTGNKPVAEENAAALEPLIRAFLTWDPIVPDSPRSLARLLAPICRLLRLEVAAFLKEPASPFRILYSEWQTTLFPGQSLDRFADAYAQTVTFSLLLANAQGGNVLDLRQAEAALAAGHMLLAKALKIFTDNLRPAEVPVSLGLLQRIINAIPPVGVKGGAKDPWLYFYEDFLAEYDPKLRKDSGSYYTPVEAVQAMTRLARSILVSRMGKPHGFASPDVLTLDPAAGTGAFLLSIIAETLNPVVAKWGQGAVAGYADVLAAQLNGFELQISPYAVAQLRLSRALTEAGASLPEEGPRIYLTDTLESPDITPQFPSLLSRELSEQHQKALAIKKSLPILVCIGNPPYDRHEASTAANRKETGGWVRWGEEDADGKYNPQSALLESFAGPVREEGQGAQLKNLYNLYVYFWRWALWKVFEHQDDTPGIVAFITAASFLQGPAFAGMRAALRRLCHDVWIIDLGGEGRGSRKEENIFNIQTPVCITIAARYGVKDAAAPAAAHYTRIAGKKAQKLAKLRRITDFDSLRWQTCETGWHAVFAPRMQGDYFSFPLLTDIFPWRQSGVKAARTWVIAPDKDLLKRRWQAIFQTNDVEKRRELFKDAPPSTGGRSIDDTPVGIFTDSRLKAIADPGRSIYEDIIAFGYRSFDRQYLLADARCLDRQGPSLWQAQGEKQIYFASTFAQPLGKGPALTLSSIIPDLCFFCNRGAKDIMPLYRDSCASEANILPGLLAMLAQTYGQAVTAEDAAAYVYALLAHAGYTELFYAELGSREIRVPLTRDAALFARAVCIGRRLICLHSYGERMAPGDAKPYEFAAGKARCLKAVDSAPAAYPEAFAYNESAQALIVGKGEFAPIGPDVFNFEVSGMKVVQSWLNYRMKKTPGRKSSPLDDMRPERWTAEYTEGLLNLLWLIEATLAQYPAQKALLQEILAGEMIRADELPPVPGEARKAPRKTKNGNDGQDKLL